MLDAVMDEYEWIKTIEPRYSVGSESAEWMKWIFDENRYKNELKRTAYVTANGKTEKGIDPDQICYIDEVWRDEFDFKWGSVPAEIVTERAIDVWKHQDPDRLLVHYIQPHFPVVPPVAAGRDVPTCLLNSD